MENPASSMLWLMPQVLEFLELFSDLSNDIDHVNRGTVTTADLVLLDHSESLSRDPLIGTKLLRDFLFGPERTQTRTFIPVLNSSVPDLLRMRSDLSITRMPNDLSLNFPGPIEQSRDWETLRFIR